jgi:hypothetical protein
MQKGATVSSEPALLLLRHRCCCCRAVRACCACSARLPRAAANVLPSSHAHTCLSFNCPPLSVCLQSMPGAPTSAAGTLGGTGLAWQPPSAALQRPCSRRAAATCL